MLPRMEYIGTLLIYLLTATVLFLRLIYWMILIEVILSWLVLLGVQIYIGPLVAVTRPIYRWVKRYVPTNIGMIEFAPIVVIIGVELLATLIITVVMPFVTRTF